MILASGCFDGLHAGHVRYLRAAAAIDPDQHLRVAIAPDRYIVKAKDRQPYWPLAERAETVQALGVVDTVWFQASTSVADVILELHPDIFVKGRDWCERLPEDVIAACQQTGTRIMFTDTVGTHTREARA